MNSVTNEEMPDWKLPRGVDRALWTYSRTERLAEEESAFFANDALCGRDLDLVAARFSTPGSLIDLGCGAGRASLAFAERGFSVLAVDLALPMLRQLSKDRRTCLSLMPLRASICDLGAVRSAAFDYALMLFSTLGMVRGVAARRAALAEAARVVKPGGWLALHAHNVLANRHNPQGRVWLARDLVASLLRSPERGDRTMVYRGIPNLVVHQFRWRELARTLRDSGWRIHEVVPLQGRPGARIPKVMPRLRSDGWMVFARREARG